MTVAILILAAGQSTRMRGGDKLLENVDGLPLIKRQVLTALPVTKDVFVTVPSRDHARAAAVSGTGCHIVPVPDAQTGMSASLKRGVGAARGAQGILVWPGDMPEIQSTDLSNLISAFQSEPDLITRAVTADGRPGHPVIFPKELFEDLKRVTGDQGARDVLQRNHSRVQHVVLPGSAAICDLDTPEDWAEWRKASQSRQN